MQRDWCGSWVLPWSEARTWSLTCCVNSFSHVLIPSVRIYRVVREHSSTTLWIMLLYKITTTIIRKSIVIHTFFMINRWHSRSCPTRPQKGCPSVMSQTNLTVPSVNKFSVPRALSCPYQSRDWPFGGALLQAPFYLRGWSVRLRPASRGHRILLEFDRRRIYHHHYHLPKNRRRWNSSAVRWSKQHTRGSQGGV